MGALDGKPVIEESTPVQSNGATVAIVLALVAIGHVATVFLLYGSRAFVRSVPLPSKVVVLALPAAIAYAGYYFTLRTRRLRVMPAWAAAFPLTFVSFVLGLFVSVNTYGTQPDTRIPWNTTI